MKTHVPPPFKSAVYDIPLGPFIQESTFEDIEDQGTGSLQVWDKRFDPARSRHMPAHKFRSTFKRGHQVVLWVDTELSLEEAREVAKRYSEDLGRIPQSLRLLINEMVIQPGYGALGGNRNQIHIHIERAEEDRCLERLGQALIHEAAHTLQNAHDGTSEWQKAKADDPTCISEFARKDCTKAYDLREDFAETFVAYVAYKSKKAPPDICERIKQAIPERLEYLEAREPFDMSPFA